MYRWIAPQSGTGPIMATFGYIRMSSAWEGGRGRRDVQQRSIAGYAVRHGLQVDQTGRLANWTIPGKMVPGMGGAMDLVTGARRVIVAMQHAAKGAPKIVKQCGLPITSLRAVDLVVTELAVIAFRNGHAVLLERAPGISVAQVLAATEADLQIPDQVPEMAL